MSAEWWRLFQDVQAAVVRAHEAVADGDCGLAASILEAVELELAALSRWSS